MSLRELYRTLELPGANRLRDAQAALDRAVGEAYAWGLPPALRGLEPLPLLLALNQRCAAAEGEGADRSPARACPRSATATAGSIPSDCLRM